MKKEIPPEEQGKDQEVEISIEAMKKEFERLKGVHEVLYNAMLEEILRTGQKYEKREESGEATGTATEEAMAFYGRDDELKKIRGALEENNWSQEALVRRFQSLESQTKKSGKN